VKFHKLLYTYLLPFTKQDPDSFSRFNRTQARCRQTDTEPQTDTLHHGNIGLSQWFASHAFDALNDNNTIIVVGITMPLLTRPIQISGCSDPRNGNPHNFGSGFGIGAETGRKLSFGVDSVSLGNTAACFGCFGRISWVISALTDRNWSHAGCVVYISSSIAPTLSGRKQTAVCVPLSSVMFTLHNVLGPIFGFRLGSGRNLGLSSGSGFGFETIRPM